MAVHKIEFLKGLDAVVGPLLVKLLSYNKPDKVEVAAVTRIGNISKVIFIRPGGIGDAVLLVPVLISLKKKYPQCCICVICEKRNFKVFEMTDSVDEIVLYDSLRHIGHLCRALFKKTDIFIDTEQWHRLSAFLVGISRSKLKIGFATNERQRCFHIKVPYDHLRYEQRSFEDLLKGIPTEKTFSDEFSVLPPFLHPWGRLDPGFQGLLSKRQIIAMFPGASIKERMWGWKNFAMLAEELLGLGLAVTLIGGKEDRTEAAKIEHYLVQRGYGGKLINITGKGDLIFTANHLRHCRVLVTGDSGIMHIGYALDVPTLSLFGPGIEQKWAPRGERHMAINKRLPCSPCTRFGYTPPCTRAVLCMQDIKVDEVFETALKLLRGQVRSGSERSFPLAKMENRG